MKTLPRVDRVDVRLSSAHGVPPVCVVSGESSSVTRAFWVRGRPLAGLLPGRSPQKWLDLPLSTPYRGILGLHRFQIGLEVWLVVYYGFLMARHGVNLTAAVIALLLVGFLEVLRRLVVRSVPRVEDVGAGELLVQRVHPAFAAALDRDDEAASHESAVVPTDFHGAASEHVDRHSSS